MYFYLHRRSRILVPEQDVHNSLRSLILLGADFVTFHEATWYSEAAPDRDSQASHVLRAAFSETCIVATARSSYTASLTSSGYSLLAATRDLSEDRNVSSSVSKLCFSIKVCFEVLHHPISDFLVGASHPPNYYTIPSPHCYHVHALPIFASGMDSDHRRLSGLTMLNPDAPTTEIGFPPANLRGPCRLASPLC
jgi:hypothetical protein